MGRAYDAATFTSDPDLLYEEQDTEIDAPGLDGLDFTTEDEAQARDYTDPLPELRPTDWKVRERKQGQTFMAFLLYDSSNGLHGVVVKRPGQQGGGFGGAAIFPSTMGPYAHRRYQELRTDTDVEGLMREFGEDAEYLDFMSFRLEQADL